MERALSGLSGDITFDMCQKHGRQRKRCKVDQFGQEVWHVEGVFNQILWKMASDGKTGKHIKSLFDI